MHDILFMCTYKFSLNFINIFFSFANKSFFYLLSIDIYDVCVCK